MLRPVAIIVFASLLAFPANAGLITLDFEGFALGGQPSNIYPGVDFSYGHAGDDAVVGGLLVFDGLTSGIQITQGDFVISGINAVSCFPISFGAPQAENLIAFATPVTTVSLVTDDAFGEFPDIIRLLALKPTANPLAFTILAIAEGTDDGTTIAANTLSITLNTPFSFVAFQRTTEAESFDDLTFGTAAVPEPASSSIFAAMIAFASLGRRKR